MKYILQKDSGVFEIEIQLLQEILDRQKALHSYEFKTLHEIETMNITQENKKATPVGTLEFVTTWLKRFHGIAKINPIEVPRVLQLEEYLKRKYKIVNAKDLPTSGRWFIKDVSQLKTLTFTGDVSWLDKDLYINSDHLYQVSEEVDIQSEYRVYIIGGKIEAISNYNGNPCIFPNMGVIERINNIYSWQKDYPKSLTMDIMINDRGTSLIEIHPFISCGLYNTLWGDNLANAYVDGIRWVLDYNTPLRP